MDEFILYQHYSYKIHFDTVTTTVNFQYQEYTVPMFRLSLAHIELQPLIHSVFLYINLDHIVSDMLYAPHN